MKPPSKSRLFRLPTLAALQAMTLRQRATIFLKWAKTRDPRETYPSTSTGRCVFAQLSTALRHPEGTGGNYGIEGLIGENSVLQVLPDGPNLGHLCPIHGPPSDPGDITSFGALVQRTTAYLKRKSLRWKPRKEQVW